MSNIEKIYKRLTLVLVKAKALPIFLSVQNIALAVLVLIYCNVIVSKGKINGELDYEQIKLFYNIVLNILFILVFIYAPFFLGGSLNSLAKSNTINYLLSNKMKINEIIYANFLRGISNVFILFLSALPIASISLYFGGVGIIKLIRILLCFCFYIFFISSVCLYISTYHIEKSATILFAYVISFFILAFHVLFFKSIINYLSFTIIYIVLTVFISLLLIAYTYNGKIFRN